MEEHKGLKVIQIGQDNNGSQPLLTILQKVRFQMKVERISSKTRYQDRHSNLKRKQNNYPIKCLDKFVKFKIIGHFTSKFKQLHPNLETIGIIKMQDEEELLLKVP